LSVGRITFPARRAEKNRSNSPPGDIQPDVTALRIRLLPLALSVTVGLAVGCSESSPGTGSGAAGTGDRAGSTGGAGTTGSAGAAGASAPGNAGTGGPGGSAVAGSAGGSSGTTGSAGTTGAGGRAGTTGAGGSAGATAGAGGVGGRGGSGGGGGTATAGQGGGRAGAGGGGASGTGGGAGTTGSAGAGGAASSKCTGGAAVTGVYYVDSAAGRDSNDGSTPATAWQTLAKVNATTYAPGNALCFKAGGSWSGQLAPKGSGSAAAPIVVDQYGTGAKPKLAAGASDLDTVLLLNVQYWEVNNLEVTNTKSAPGDLRGICLRGKDAGALNHLTIRNCFVHDVTGVVNWIGGSTSDNQAPWVTFQTGWDDSKRTGGIVVEVTSTAGTKTWFNDVVIENNVVQDNSFGGIVFKQYDGGYGWGVRASKTDSKFTPHTNVVVRSNFISQTNTQYGCNAIYMTGSQHVLIERNVSKDAGTSAIEAYNSDDVRIQYNETFGTVRKAGGADYNGIDTDRATTGAVVQYNYVHDNGDGILLCQFAFGDSVVRYNLLVNNSRHGINLHSDSSATNQTYNNLVFYTGSASANLVATSGDSTYLDSPYTIRNNIFYTTRSAAMVASGSGTTYANNLFGGIAAVGSAAQTGDPMFVNSATHPSGGASGPALTGLAGFQVKAGSPAIDHGVSISGNGGVDFWGNPLYHGSPDIGPYEAP
jgi:hypothetical protein